MIDKVICEIDGLRKDPDSDEVVQYRLDEIRDAVKVLRNLEVEE